MGTGHTRSRVSGRPRGCSSSATADDRARLDRRAPRCADDHRHRDGLPGIAVRCGPYGYRRARPRYGPRGDLAGIEEHRASRPYVRPLPPRDPALANAVAVRRRGMSSTKPSTESRSRPTSNRCRCSPSAPSALASTSWRSSCCAPDRKNRSTWKAPTSRSFRTRSDHRCHDGRLRHVSPRLAGSTRIFGAGNMVV